MHNDKNKNGCKVLPMKNRCGRCILQMMAGMFLAVVLLGAQCEEAQKNAPAQPHTRKDEFKKEQPAPKETPREHAKKSDAPTEKSAPLPLPFISTRERNLDKWRDRLSSGDRDFRSFAAISLLRSGDKASVDLLMNMLKSAPDEIRLTIIKAFQFDENTQALDELVALLADPNADVRHTAIEALGEMRTPEAISRMSSVLADTTKPSAIRVGVAAALGRTKKKEAVGALVGVLSENDEMLRKTAVNCLLSITRRKDLGEDPQKWREWWDRHRWKSSEDFYQMILEGMEQQLDNALQSFNQISDMFAEATIAELAKKNDLNEFIKESTNINPKVRKYVAQELVKFKTDPAFQALSKMIADKSEVVRSAVAESLGKTGDKRAVQILIPVLKNDPDPLVQQEAAASLGKLASPQAFEPLVQALEHTHPSVSSTAASALGELGDTRAVPALIAVMTNTERPAATREQAAGALGKLGDTRAVAPLITVLSDTNDRLRWYAAMALGKLGDAAAVKPLCQILTTDGTPNVREAAAMSLGILRNKEAMDSLSKAVHDPDPNVANAAREALFTIAGDDCVTLLMVGQILMAKSEYPAAIRIFQKLVEKYADSPQYTEEVYRAKEALAQCYAKINEWKNARELYEDLVKRDPSRADTRQGLVKAMIQNKEYTLAAKFYLDSLAHAPEQSALWWSELYKLLEERFVEITPADVLLIIEDALKVDQTLGGEVLKEKFLRLKARAQQTEKK